VLLRPVTDTLELVMTIPGVGRRVGDVLIAEVGLDMTVPPCSSPDSPASSARPDVGGLKSVPASRDWVKKTGYRPWSGD